MDIAQSLDEGDEQMANYYVSKLQEVIPLWVDGQQQRRQRCK